MRRLNKYKGYYIVGPFNDKTFDVEDMNDELVDGDFKSSQDAMDMIDELVKEGE